ncbi:DUF1992 domain-containing protein [Desulfopila sp. IMCC35006]|nr:DUF1992 domain-containing protein [Desulfopila sp. IMCC35006]
MAAKHSACKILDNGGFMDSLAFIAEQRIAEAMREKDLNSPKWKNKPLPLEDDRFVPEDLKMAYKILKNSGYLPPEIEERKQIKKLEDLIACTEDEHERLKQMKKLNVLLMKVDAKRPNASSISSQHEYYRQVVERITVRSKTVKK